MAVQSTFNWLGESAAGQYLAESTPAFAAVQSVHLLALATLGGAVIIADLASARLLFRASGPAAVVKGSFPVFLAGLAAAVISGTLLVAAGPTKYLLNPLFWPKLAVLAVAIAIHLTLYRVVLRQSGEAAARVLAWLSIALWLSVTVIGRWVGLI
jgi:hypothetical protein